MAAFSLRIGIIGLSIISSAILIPATKPDYISSSDSNDFSNERRSDYSYSSSQFCSYAGVMFVAGDSLRVDGCTMMGCFDGYVRADIHTCYSVSCDNPFKETFATGGAML